MQKQISVSSKKYGGELASMFMVPEHQFPEFVKKHIDILTPRSKATIRNYLLGTPELMKEN